jgi:hypothetical protein
VLSFIIIAGVIIKESKPVIHHKVQKGTIWNIFGKRIFGGVYFTNWRFHGSMMMKNESTIGGAHMGSYMERFRWFKNE